MRPETVSVLTAAVAACFLGTWVVLGIGGIFLFHLRKDVAFKRKWFPWFIVLIGVLFVFFSTTIAVLSSQSLGALRALVFVVPVVCLISWLNIRCAKFCDKCGSTVYRQFSPMRFCPKCGAKLDAKPNTQHDTLD
jgi:hypothetical protein